jgi:hypothetical protein
MLEVILPFGYGSYRPGSASSARLFPVGFTTFSVQLCAGNPNASRYSGQGNADSEELNAHPGDFPPAIAQSAERRRMLELLFPAAFPDRELRDEGHG